MIRLLDGYGLPARCYPGKPGVWIDRRKIGFVGLNAQGGVTTHGLALNVTGDLAPFAHIVPCGLEGCEVASIRALTGRDVSVRDAAERFAPVLEEFLGEPLATWEPASVRAWAREGAA